MKSSGKNIELASFDSIFSTEKTRQGGNQRIEQLPLSDLVPFKDHPFRVVDDDRIAAYQDGTVWRMIIVLFHAVLAQEPKLKSSKESSSLRFFTREELKQIEIVQTHGDLVEQWRLSQL